MAKKLALIGWTFYVTSLLIGCNYGQLTPLVKETLQLPEVLPEIPLSAQVQS